MQPRPHGSSFYLPFCQYLKSGIYLSSCYRTPNLAAEFCLWTILHMYKLASSQVHWLSILPIIAEYSSVVQSCRSKPAPPSSGSLHHLYNAFTFSRWFPASPLTSVTLAPQLFPLPLLSQGKMWEKWPFCCPGLTPSVLGMYLLLKPWFTNHPLSSANPAIWLPGILF